MEYVSLVAKKIRPFLSLIIFFLVFTISFSIVIGTLKYTIPFIVGLVAAAILKKPTEWLINKFQIKGNLAAIISTLVFYIITVTLLILGVVFFCSEIKDLATEGYEYIYDNGGKIGILIQDSLSKFKNIDPAILDSNKGNPNNIKSLYVGVIVRGCSKFPILKSLYVYKYQPAKI